MDNCTLRTHIINLFVLGTAIILVFVAKRNYKDYFVPVVQKTPIGNGGFPTNPHGGHPQGQPMRFQKQIWPVNTPYMPKPWASCSTNQTNGFSGCGATGRCVDGRCEDLEFNKTTFNNRINPMAAQQNTILGQ